MSAVATEKLLHAGNVDGNVSAWFYDIRRTHNKMRRTVLRIGKRKNRDFVWSHHALYRPHQVKTGDLETVRDLPKDFSQIFPQRCDSARIGRPDSLVCQQAGKSSHEMDESL